MVRNRKVWGVLGLLLALVVFVGYGQQPLSLAPHVLTVNRGCTRAAGFGFELFLINLDMHPTRNITYMNDPASVGFPRPNNPANCPGVAYFFPGDPGFIQVYINLPGNYTPKVCFRKFPPPPSADPPRLIITATASFALPLWSAVQTITATPSCQCVTGPALNVPPGTGQWVKWKFEISDNSVEFCRVEIH